MSFKLGDRVKHYYYGWHGTVTAIDPVRKEYLIELDGNLSPWCRESELESEPVTLWQKLMERLFG